jgi:hypothetical protein
MFYSVKKQSGKSSLLKMKNSSHIITCRICLMCCLFLTIIVSGFFVYKDNYDIFYYLYMVFTTCLSFSFNTELFHAVFVCLR